MSKNDRKIREHWYSGITEAFQMYLPGSKVYHTIPARRARIGTLFILPFIIGFIAFMVMASRPAGMSGLISRGMSGLELMCWMATATALSPRRADGR